MNNLLKVTSEVRVGAMNKLNNLISTSCSPADTDTIHQTIQ